MRAPPKRKVWLLKGPAFSKLWWCVLPVEVPAVIEEVVARHVSGLGDGPGAVHVDHHARHGTLAGTIQRIAELSHRRLLAAGEAEDLVGIEHDDPVAQAEAAEEYLEPGRPVVAVDERVARLPQVDVGLVAKKVERPIGTAVVDGQEGRYAESPVFGEKPGKPRGFVADDEAAEHFARVNVYRPIVHAAKAMPSERSLMTVQFGQRGDQVLVKQRLFRKAAKPVLAHVDRVLPAPLVGENSRELDVCSLQGGVDLDGATEVLQRPVHEALPEPAATEAELGQRLAGVRRLDPAARTSVPTARSRSRGHGAAPPRPRPLRRGAHMTSRRYRGRSWSRSAAWRHRRTAEPVRDRPGASLWPQPGHRAHPAPPTARSRAGSLPRARPRPLWPRPADPGGRLRAARRAGPRSRTTSPASSLRREGPAPTPRRPLRGSRSARPAQATWQGP